MYRVVSVEYGLAHFGAVRVQSRRVVSSRVSARLGSVAGRAGNVS